MTLDAAQQFHNELLGIAKLGIPLNLGFDGTSKDPSTELDEIAATLKQTVRDDQTFAETIAKMPQLSPAYRSALATWLATDGSPIAFESVVAPAVARQQSRGLWTLSLLQPIVILAMSYLAIIYICVFTIPKLEAIYEQTDQLPHFALATMVAIRKSMPIWIPLVPILVGLAYFLQEKRSAKHLNAPKILERRAWGRTIDAVEAEQLAALINSHVALPIALALVQNDRQATSNSIGPNTTASDRPLRPMLQWAVSEESDSQKIRSLKMVAATYRKLARDQSQRIQNWLPPLAMGVLGGCLVLGVGLSVFWPIVELLYDLAKPGTSR